MTRLLSVLLLYPSLLSAEISSEVVDKDALTAYHEYWTNFDQIEQSRQAKSKLEFEKRWLEARKEFQLREYQDIEKQKVLLRKTVRKYKDHLDDHKDGDNTPFVILNLSHVLFDLGLLVESSDQSEASDLKEEALQYIDTIVSEYPLFERLPDSMYLKALIYESMGRDNAALAAWELLARKNSNSLFVVHANVAMGDHYFRKEDPASGIPFYRKALSAVEKVSTANKDYEKLRVEYRLMWAAYRSAELDIAIKMGINVLQPGRQALNIKMARNISRDAIEILGDSLFEDNDPNYARSVIGRKELHLFADRIGLRVLDRYMGAELHQDAAEMGAFLSGKFHDSSVLPDILWQTSRAHKAQRSKTYLTYLKQLVLLLPSSSLWRMRHRKDLDSVNRMEELAEQAGVDLSQHYYTYGLSTTNRKGFMQTINFLKILIEFRPGGERSITYRKMLAEAQFHADDHEEAEKTLQDMLSNHKLPSQILERASYLLALTKEKLWRKEYGNVAARGGTFHKKKELMDKMASFGGAVTSYANRFPNEAAAIDLLLVVASAYRDMALLDQAEVYWDRVLVSTANSVQRGMAVRGLVMSSLQKGNLMDLIERTDRFLRLEKWSKLGFDLRSELLGVLDAAVIKEGRRLASQGETERAGNLMISTASKYSTIPSREALYRDGAYYLAIAGKWAAAQKASEEYLGQDLSAEGDDLLYLKAKSLEYQMRFARAAAFYLELGIKYPKHSRAVSSLERAERLGRAVGNISLAARALERLGDYASSDKVPLYIRASDAFGEAGELENRRAVLEKARQAAKSEGDKLKIRLQLAKIDYSQGNESQALKEYVAIASLADKRNMVESDKREILGECYLLLGAESMAKFRDFDVQERSGRIMNNIDQKRRYYTELSQRFNQVIEQGAEEYVVQARFHLAQASEDFSDELGRVATEMDLSSQQSADVGSLIPRFRSVAKQLYGANVVAGSKNKKVLANNIWVKRSQMKLSGYSDLNYATKDIERTPISMPLRMPNSWRL